MSLPSSIHEVPFFRLLIPISIGITIQIYFNILPSTPIIAMASTLLFCSLLISSYFSKQWKYRWIYGIMLNTFLIFAGLALAINTSQDKHLVTNTESQAIVRLINSPQERTRSLRVECQLTEIIDSHQYKASHEKILVYFNLSDSCAKTLKYGDIVALKLKLREFEKPKNPNQFDIAKYMKQEGIRFSSFVKNGEWILLGNNANPIINYSLKLRDTFISVFRTHFIVDNQLAVLSALTLGYRELLDDEINRVYSSTGAVHILSVSGLHVGILYLFLVFLLSAIPSNRFTELFKLITVLLFLWFFAILTGLSPSVNRSALMFSLVAIGKWYGIRSNIYNTLAIAAFTLLAINPYNIMNIGFQLSFLAVLSIVVFYPSIHSLLYFKNKIASYIWSLIAVSIAAQIGTLPITLGLFSQFPNYFILTNLIAIPLSTAILYLSVLLLVISPFQIIATFLGKTLNLLLITLNSSLSWIESLPFSITSGIHLSSAQMLVFMMGLFFLATFLLYKKLIHFQISLFAFIILIALGFSIKNRIFDDEFVVFNLPRNSAACFRIHGEAFFVNINNSSNNVEQNKFYIEGYIKQNTIRGRYNSLDSSNYRSNSTIIVNRANGLALLGANRFIVAIPYNDSTHHIQSSSKIDVNAIMVNSNFSPNILNFIKPQVAIIDNSVPKWRMDKILITLASANIPIHHLNSQGAYRQKLK